MKKSIILIAVLSTLIGCKKDSELVELEYNKWEETINSTIIVDSSTANPIDPTYGDILVYTSFDETGLEQDWSTISKMHAVYQKITFPVGPEISKQVSFNNGQAVFNPPNTYNNTTYTFRFYLEFDNGRNTLWSSTYMVTAPPF